MHHHTEVVYSISGRPSNAFLRIRHVLITTTGNISELKKYDLGTYDNNALQYIYIPLETGTV